MAVYRDTRRKNAPWIIDISYVDKRTGKKGRFFRNAHCQTAPAARAEERTLLVFYAEHGHLDVQSLAATATNDPTVKQLWTWFGEHSPPHSHSTLVGYEKNMKAYILPRFGHVRLSELEASKLSAFDTELSRDGLSLSTRNNITMGLRSAVRHAIKCGYIEKKPAFPPLHRPEQKIFTPPTEAEVAGLLAVARPHVRTALGLAALAGLRAGEVRGLKWADVDLERQFLVVRTSICHGVEGTPKSGNHREVAVGPELAAILTEAKKTRSKDQVLVAPSSLGAAWTEGGLRSAFKDALSKANLPKKRLHDLRHFFITSCFVHGADAVTVQQLAGHIHLSVTQRYAHTTKERKKAAVQWTLARSA